MKITTTYLRQIIKEGLDAVLAEEEEEGSYEDLKDLKKEIEDLKKKIQLSDAAFEDWKSRFERTLHGPYGDPSVDAADEKALADMAALRGGSSSEPPQAYPPDEGNDITF